MSESRSTRDRVRPVQDWGVSAVHDVDGSVLCGHRALAYVLGDSLEHVVRRVGHGRAMRLREIQHVIRVHGRYAPTYVSGDVLTNDPTRLWWAHGGDRFLAILAALDLDAPVPGSQADGMLGHAVILHGRTLLDPAGGARPIARIVSPTVLAQYQLAIIFSPRGSP